MLLPTRASYIVASESHFGRILLENGLPRDMVDTSFQVLDERTLNEFWMLNFRNDGRKRKIPDDFWMFHCDQSKPICNWIEGLSCNDFKAVATCLAMNCKRPHYTPMCFFGGIEVVLFEWKNFIKYWNSFVEFNDEGLVVELTGQSGLLINPNGNFIAV